MNSEFFPFGLVSSLWLLLALAVCGYMSSTPEEWKASFVGAFILWAICNLDLLVLKNLVSNVLNLISLTDGNRLRVSIRALFWGVLKLICLGLFIIVLLKGHKIPTQGLLLGVSTLVVIPLVGGFLWSQRIVPNA